MNEAKSLKNEEGEHPVFSCHLTETNIEKI